ncbi:MAG: serine O-acetyltransferase EpsC [Niameybacter sp.]
MSYIKEQIKVIKERDPAIKSTAEVFLYPSFYALLFHKMGHRLYKREWYFLARLISQLARGLTGIEIHPGAIIGKRLFIDHGMGVVIGETCEIGDNVTIYHGVTLGGTGKDHGKRHPTIGNNVMISTGAKVLGPFKVGDNSRIAANAVVLQEIPEDCTVVGIPGRIVRVAGQRVDPCQQLDQVKVPDPVQMEICKMRQTVEELQSSIQQVKQELEKVKNQRISSTQSKEVQDLEDLEDNGYTKCTELNCLNKEACETYRN